MNTHKFIKSIFEVSHVVFTAYDLHTKQLICSSGMGQKVLGYTADEYEKLKDHFYENIIHPDEVEKVIASLKKLEESQENEIVETIARYRKADGEYIWVYSRRIVSERDSKGHSLKITSISQDVTEEIRLQEELKKSTELLDEVSYKNSHEVRGPVATILGLVNLMDEKGFISDLNKECFRYLKIAVRKLDEIITEINDLTDPGVEKNA